MPLMDTFLSQLNPVHALISITLSSILILASHLLSSLEVFRRKLHTRYGSEVPEMILSQEYPHIYSLLKGDTFKVLPLSRYALHPKMLELCHGGESNWAKVQTFFYPQLHVTASVSPHNKFRLIVYPCGMNSK
jgi:hypothetical protein